MFRKTGVILGLTILISGFALQTGRAQSAFQFGIRGGVNFANVTNSKFNTDVRRGFSAGGYIRYHLPGSPLALQPELLYTQKGYNRNELTTRFDYIEVPFLLNFKLSEKSSFGARIYVGPYVAFNVRADQEQGEVGPVFGDQKSPRSATVVDQTFSDRVQDTDLGLVVGIGVDLLAHLSLGARYTAGLTKVFETDRDIKNRVFTITAGIGF